MIDSGTANGRIRKLAPIIQRHTNLARIVRLSLGIARPDTLNPL
jgi:hypothetical protein